MVEEVVNISVSDNIVSSFQVVVVEVVEDVETLWSFWNYNDNRIWFNITFFLQLTFPIIWWQNVH